MFISGSTTVLLWGLNWDGKMTKRRSGVRFEESAFRPGGPVDLMSTAARPKRSRVQQLAEADDLDRRRALGQFFTPADVASFMWDMVEVLRKRRWHEGDSVIDPACGDGAFLRVAIERGQKRNGCYGLDIDETLVRTWKDAGLRGARIYCDNGLENHPALGVVPGAFDLVIGNPPFAGTGLKNLLQLLPQPGKGAKQARSMFADQLPDSTSAPPGERAGPLSADARKRLDSLVRQLAGYQCWRLCDASAEADEAAEAGDGALFSGVDLPAKRSRKSVDYERMAKAVQSTPADRPLNATLPEVRDAIRRMASTSIEVFFTERFVQLARPGGMVAVIVPESILASDQLGPLRLWLMQQAQLMAVVSLPHKTFTGVGANAKTGIIFARRYTLAEQRANAKAKETTPGCRMTPELRSNQVIMVSPRLEHADWTMQQYLSEVIEGVRAHQQDATKGLRK